MTIDYHALGVYSEAAETARQAAHDRTLALNDLTRLLTLTSGGGMALARSLDRDQANRLWNQVQAADTRMMDAVGIANAAAPLCGRPLLAVR
ncbi:hypothetical protein [Insolitispirillum peregrinum]|uniref:Uncharacterized protein n=1 Tax=Insolitispirillum peregrinum TaxID=80876 RepID=A0A1N7LSG6_9PROT|nr:hypothetical protein [Insolitispirillum peregrinum]SIS76714.1 hypothetical protein SAMN05421779_103526 [Insolitispirillum peregrinum]